MIKVDEAVKGINVFWVHRIPKHKNGQGGLFEAWKKRNFGQIEKNISLHSKS